MTSYLLQFSDSDRDLIAGLLRKVDLLKEELEGFVGSGNTCNFESLQLARLRGSNTLLHDTTEVEGWNLALRAVWTWIQEGRSLELKAFFEINRILLKIPQDQSPARKIALFAAGNTFPSPEELEILLNAFECEIGSILENEHPLIQAAWIYQKLIAIHPFQDGNGRTGRLAADWALARLGFPPMVFLSPVDAMVPPYLDAMDLKMRLAGIIRVANAIQTSAQILTIRINNQV